ncbi:cytidine deaminase-like protein [Dunaliella salina]|uniref:Cytidine deaminase-like protein n=1 Tax=Dunaliella salina TaxID=3046 RepID=A0ABQ7GH43_DUNSA|nr:cytidine deaminase-like protein [Dunaliella salina]|eukprot:KAF5833916.1 cytidine deaminase-like protein [Dunaliella salina]
MALPLASLNSSNLVASGRKLVQKSSPSGSRSVKVSALSHCGTPLSASPARLQPLSRLPVSPLRRSLGTSKVSAAAMEAAKRALISLSDKSDLEKLVKGLNGLGYEIVSTGGTYSAIEKMGIPVKKVEDLTGFPEMLDGRVKTLHPAVHGGILAIRDKADHMSAIEQHKIGTIDLVVVNLYPFRSTVTATPPPSFDNGVENIDIGGPAMIRAAAKNMGDVTVAVDPADYDGVLAHAAPGADPTAAAEFRKKLAWKAFQHCSSYDAQVAEWLWGKVGEGPAPMMTVPLQLGTTLRYGENPHQAAAFYTDVSLREFESGGVAQATVHHGKEMSYNNFLPACVIVKHTNPCGVAMRGDLLEAYRLAVRADPISAFGGIVAFNREVTAELAKEIREFRSPTDNETRMFYEIVIAPSYSPEGLEILKGKSKNLRILEAKARPPSGLSLRQVSGGWLWQMADSLTPENITFTPVSETKPTPEQVRICMEKAGAEAEGAVMASDAFFPFSWNDGVELACQLGIKAIAHPGGSIRDQDAIDCCNKYGVALVTTGARHFKH